MSLDLIVQPSAKRDIAEADEYYAQYGKADAFVAAPDQVLTRAPAADHGSDERPTSSAMAAASGSPSSRRPDATPAQSASDRFWLTFHFPTSRVMGSSTPGQREVIVDAIRLEDVEIEAVHYRRTNDVDRMPHTSPPASEACALSACRS